MGIHLVQFSGKFQMQNPQTKIPKELLAPISTKSKYFQKKILIFVKIIFSSEKNSGDIMVHFNINTNCQRWCIFSDGCVPSLSLTRFPACVWLPWYWDISLLMELGDFCVSDAYGRCSPVVEARLKRRLKAGGKQLNGHSCGQFTIRYVSIFFKWRLLNFSFKAYHFLSFTLE